MIKFDTKVQLLKYKVLKEVAKYAFEDKLLENMMKIPENIIPGKNATMRCCVYKERAIVSERVKIAIGGDKRRANIVEVINIACDECPVGGYEVTAACRGCIAHRCEQVCPKNAISFDHEQKAHIDKTKCVECGLCAKVCPFSAILSYKRPCEKACKVVNAISMNSTKEAKIDDKKCVSCGACINQCPFGAIMDKSFILDVIDLIKKSENNTKYKLYAVVAPSISSQFSGYKLGQVITGLKKLGFYHVVEAALGADMVAMKESSELEEKGFLTSSCCPAFVSYIKKNFPDLEKDISHNFSPMAEISKYIKETTPGAKVVFIGPCTAKKMEAHLDNVRPYVDNVITFEELQALFGSKDIDLGALEEGVLDNASYYGRIFARSGGLSDAVAQAFKEKGSSFACKPVICDGLEACKMALLKAKSKILDGNFIEGMACQGGCIGGAGCLTHGPKDKNQVDAYGKEALEKTITDAISVLGTDSSNTSK
ncbi:Hydrogenase large subunit domain protein [Elusimicrobium minutum Pei191]|uniref:Hydrogenase large subunit domain protein n=1 Tax=Elusimicrobium minutum (strain Pei191) TaxID=445932 RepID=B2KCQ9_ELUMP|nr:4Fe-4S dicluster domain-containing protein [Elusimicrobium minutum]ACC98305.1 Hydrogenase large subunit domain protein [Elusimicrobium minutum Pei191]